MLIIVGNKKYIRALYDLSQTCNNQSNDGLRRRQLFEICRLYGFNCSELITEIGGKC